MNRGLDPRHVAHVPRVGTLSILLFALASTPVASLLIPGTYSFGGGDAIWVDVTAHDLKLLPNVQPTDVHMYGRAVALAGDVMIVGAQSGSDLGAAYVFRRDPDTEEWVEEAKLQASDGEIGDEFGYSVAIQGEIAAVGAMHDSDRGTVYMFRHADGEWTEEQKIHEVGAISLALDGDLIAIGDQDDGDQGFVAGAVRLWRYDPGEEEWEEEQKVTASNGDEFDRFGYSIDLDGDRMAIGAFQAEYQSVASGVVYLFEFDGDDWYEVDQVGEDDGGESLDSFGVAVSLKDDLLLVGAYLDDQARNNAGAAFVFRLNESTGKWGLEQKLMGSEAGVQDFFGWTVGLDHEFCVIGTYRDDDEATDGGALYVYRYFEGVWTEVFKLVAGDAEIDDWLGYATAIDGDTVLAGAPHDDDFGDDVGASYLYKIKFQEFLRGDANADGKTVAVVDGVFLLAWGFLLGPEPPCMDAADVDGDNRVSPIGDPLRLLRWAFSDGDIPPTPGPEVCGIDPDLDTDVDCETPPEDCR